ncbi:MAG: DASS family sodium-coupled anion symporter [Ruaniaceae bacterium]|nr:DASS family sodium-coupled anion symporter [Ruaniaceae bacterium]
MKRLIGNEDGISMTTLTGARPKLRTLQKVGLALGAVFFLIPFVADIPGLEEDGERMLAIFLLAIAFWVTEAIPLFATATLVILLEVLLVSSSAVLPVGEQAAPAASYFAAMANPVIILFLGGFLIADGAAKFGLDRNIAAVFMKPFARSGRLLLLGMMLITAVLSMFMSNTATTAAMFAIVMPLIVLMPTEKARAALALSIPVAANIGGMGTPVGTPPNAVAVGTLANAGIRVSFVDWMIMAVPLMLVLLVFAWLVLARWVPKGSPITLDMDADFDRSRDAKVFYVVAGLTLALWMTEPLHGVSSNIVGFLPVVLLLAMRVMNGSDIQALDWPVLWLVAGGIALGDGVGKTGLDVWLLGSFNWAEMATVMALLVFTLIGLGMSNVISHSATANLLVPLAVSFSATLGISPILIAIVMALSTSLGMSMPISTPPNAIAFSTGTFKLKEMAIVGLVVGVVGAILLVFAMPAFWELTGILGT